MKPNLTLTLEQLERESRSYQRTPHVPALQLEQPGKRLGPFPHGARPHTWFSNLRQAHAVVLHLEHNFERLEM